MPARMMNADSAIVDRRTGTVNVCAHLKRGASVDDGVPAMTMTAPLRDSRKRDRPLRPQAVAAKPTPPR